MRIEAPAGVDRRDAARRRPRRRVALHGRRSRWLAFAAACDGVDANVVVASSHRATARSLFGMLRCAGRLGWRTRPPHGSPRRRRDSRLTADVLDGERGVDTILGMGVRWQASRRSSTTVFGPRPAGPGADRAGRRWHLAGGARCHRARPKRHRHPGNRGQRVLDARPEASWLRQSPGGTCAGRSERSDARSKHQRRGGSADPDRQAVSAAGRPHRQLRGARRRRATRNQSRDDRRPGRA